MQDIYAARLTIKHRRSNGLADGDPTSTAKGLFQSLNFESSATQFGFHDQARFPLYLFFNRKLPAKLVTIIDESEMQGRVSQVRKACHMTNFCSSNRSVFVIDTILILCGKRGLFS